MQAPGLGAELGLGGGHRVAQALGAGALGDGLGDACLHAGVDPAVFGFDTAAAGLQRVVFLDTPVLLMLFTQ